MNTLFRIAFGDYEFVLDRTSLTYSLTETATKTVWAESLSLGWIELKERETEAVTRTDFGDCKLISIAEKMGAAGKRILLGLDAPGGIPVDIYLICGPKEIQLTVEASRDSKTHTLECVGLLPELCHTHRGGYLVLPHGEGIRLAPKNVSVDTDIYLRTWEPYGGLTMPFVGAIHHHGSALTLITDSIYSAAHLKREQRKLSASWIYECDPERRRLDIRVAVIPKGDYIAIARTYREKLIQERNHLTLRKKLRENPTLERLIGQPFIHDQTNTTWVEDWAASRGDRRTLTTMMMENLPPVLSIAWLAHCLSYLADDSISWNDSEGRICRWDRMEHRLGLLAQAKEKFPVVGISHSWGDWAAIATDFCLGLDTPTESTLYGVPLPLHATVWRDAVLFPWEVTPKTFLSALLRLAPPYFHASYLEPRFLEAIQAILCTLHSLTFPAFLTAHKFLTPDFLVEEAHYSDKTYILINQSETESYDSGELLLPPGGFYVRHPQFEAHDALRVGTVEFLKRAWRVRRSLDDKPLEQSEQIEEREFEVS